MNMSILYVYKVVLIQVILVFLEPASFFILFLQFQPYGRGFMTFVWLNCVKKRTIISLLESMSV
jgi:hypothetical protein